MRALPGLQIATFSPCLYLSEGALLFLPLFMRAPVLSDQGSTLMTSFNLNSLLKNPVSNLVRWEGRLGLQHDKFQGVTFQFIAVPLILLC